MRNLRGVVSYLTRKGKALLHSKLVSDPVTIIKHIPPATASVLRTIASTCMGGAEGNTVPTNRNWPPFSRAGGMPQIMRGGKENG